MILCCIKYDAVVLMEGETQASLHGPTAIGAVGDAAAEPPPLGSRQAGSAAVDPVGQVSGHAGPVVLFCDLSLADSLTVVTLIVMELLEDRVNLVVRQNIFHFCQ